MIKWLNEQFDDRSFLYFSNSRKTIKINILENHTVIACSIIIITATNAVSNKLSTP